MTGFWLNVFQSRVHEAVVGLNGLLIFVCELFCRALSKIQFSLFSLGVEWKAFPGVKQGHAVLLSP